MSEEGYTISQLFNDYTKFWINKGYQLKKVKGEEFLVKEAYYLPKTEQSLTSLADYYRDGYKLKLISGEHYLVKGRLKTEKTLIKQDEALTKILDYMREGKNRFDAIDQVIKDYKLQTIGYLPGRLPSFISGLKGTKGTVSALFDYDRYGKLASLINEYLGSNRRTIVNEMIKNYAPFRDRDVREAESLLNLLIYLGFLKKEGEGRRLRITEVVPVYTIIELEGEGIKVEFREKHIKVIQLSYDIYVLGIYPSKNKPKTIRIRVRKTIKIGIEAPEGDTIEKIFEQIRDDLGSEGFIDEVLDKFEEEVGWIGGIEMLKENFDFSVDTDVVKR